jgi:hypothetical protein
VIERLVTGLRTLASAPANTLGDPGSAGPRGDLADAIRLELDCPQQSLTPRQRASLARLGDLLDSNVPDPLALHGAVRDACVALELGPSPRE